MLVEWEVGERSRMNFDVSMPTHFPRNSADGVTQKDRWFAQSRDPRPIAGILTLPEGVLFRVFW